MSYELMSYGVVKKVNNVPVGIAESLAHRGVYDNFFSRIKILFLTKFRAGNRFVINVPVVLRDTGNENVPLFHIGIPERFFFDSVIKNHQGIRKEPRRVSDGQLVPGIDKS